MNLKVVWSRGMAVQSGETFSSTNCQGRFAYLDGTDHLLLTASLHTLDLETQIWPA